MNSHLIYLAYKGSFPHSLDFQLEYYINDLLDVCKHLLQL